MNDWTLQFDGLCEPSNPGGTIAWGWLLNDGNRIYSNRGSLSPAPENTNNKGEYFALGFGLRNTLAIAQKIGRPDRLIVQGDSQLVIKQLNGVFACHNPYLAACRTKCLDLLKAIDPLPGLWLAEWIPREQNEAADALSREAYKLATGRDAPTRARKNGVGK
jgi:ribonuclease HI